jgi:phosphoribosylformimino-5-aminoimidazole carboxamide ribotide isomerase
MQTIGVLDLVGGRAVHARGGQRECYAPVSQVAGIAVAHGDALGIARTYVDCLGIPELYLADLDAIAGRQLQRTLIGALTSLGVPVWLDAGVSSSDRARHILGLGVTRVIVGLETLASFDALADVCAAVGSARVAFSLDLRDGRPIARINFDTLSGNGVPAGESGRLIAADAAQAGAGAIIVIDLARVGTGTGVDLGLVGRVREAAPGLMLIAGGGVRGPTDLRRLADAGCDGALVASALQNGRISAADIADARRYVSPRR